MALLRKAALIALATMVVATGSYILNRAGIDVGRAITESRCQAGAFVYHSAKANTVTDDTHTGDSVSPQVGLLSASASNTKLIGPNLIPNGGLERLEHSGHPDHVEPESWYANIYGKNQATFAVVAGHNSKSAVRTEIASYADGTADWYYDTVKVKPGQYYQYTDYYRSDVATRAVLMLQDASGRTQYINLRNAAPAANWTRYQDTFFVPANITQAQVFHPLATKGFLEIDDVSMAAAEPRSFNRALVSLSFDDGWRGIHDQALPLMQRYGIVSTQYIISGYVGQAKDYVSAKQLYNLRDNGHEIASHSVDHVDLTTQDAKTVGYELERSKLDLAKCYGLPSSYAAPYGTYNADTIKQVEKYYQTARSTDAGFNTGDNLNPYRLLVQNITADTTTEQLNAWLDTARTNNAWLILVYHDVSGSQDAFTRKPADFERDLQSIKASGLAIKTVSEAFTEVRPQAK